MGAGNNAHHISPLPITTHPLEEMHTEACDQYDLNEMILPNIFRPVFL